eukprot:sb/3462382/
MNVIVRPIPKGRLSISFWWKNKLNRFERTEVEPVGDFLKRLKSRWKDDVKSVTVLDSTRNPIAHSLCLSTAMNSGNYLCVDKAKLNILFDPPAIEKVEIYKAASYFVGVDILHSKTIGPVESNPSFARLISRARPRPSSITTRVISYNILADSFMETRTKPVVNHFPWCPKKFQARAYREPRIAGEIRAHDPDIVCMQEYVVQMHVMIGIPSRPFVKGPVAYAKQNANKKPIFGFSQKFSVWKFASSFDIFRFSCRHVKLKMNVIVRPIPKGRLSISFWWKNKLNRFERTEVEPVGDFLKRLKSRWKDDVKSVTVLDSTRNPIAHSLCLSTAMNSGNYLCVDKAKLNILFDPPAIEKVEIYKAASYFVGVDILHSKTIGPVESNPSFARLISRARPRPSSITTRVISYNILADSFMETRTKPVVNHFPWCPKKFQARAYREPRIAGEIRAHDPDIVCMQEVEGHAFDQTLQQMLPDYCGNLRTVMKGRNKVGCCIFYRRTQYQELHYETVELPQEYSSEGSLTELGKTLAEKFPEFMADIAIRPILSQILVLKSTVTGQNLVVGNTHLFWNPEYSKVTFLHAHALCTKLQEVREKFGNARVVLCGDMNSQTTSLVHEYFTCGRVQTDGTELGDFFASKIQNPLSLKLARGEPNYTNYTADFKDVIDYVLCDSQSEVVAVTPSSDLTDLERSEGCPNTNTSKQPIRTRCLGHVTVYQPIMDQYCLDSYSDVAVTSHPADNFRGAFNINF